MVLPRRGKILKIVLVLKNKKLLGMREFKRLARILQIEFGCSLDDKKSIFKILEEKGREFDSQFTVETRDDLVYFPGFVQGYYDDKSHTIYLAEEVYDRAWHGDEDALFSIVHEIAHWALITLLKIEPEFIIIEIPAAFTVTNDAELYADLFACCMMIPHFVFNGSKKVKHNFMSGRTSLMHRIPLVYLSGRRYYRAIGFHKAKKIA